MEKINYRCRRAFYYLSPSLPLLLLSPLLLPLLRARTAAYPKTGDEQMLSREGFGWRDGEERERMAGRIIARVTRVTDATAGE